MANDYVGEVISQSKPVLERCTDPTIVDQWDPVCYILLRELEDGTLMLKDEFWVKIYGPDALRIYKPGQKVRVKLNFHVSGSSKKRHQRVMALSISPATDDETR